MTFETLLIVAGALCGGFVNGLSGFGTSLVALPFWVHALQPAVAAQLGAASGVIGNLQTLHVIWPKIRWQNVGHYIVAGLLGVPVGTLMLPHIDPRLFKLGVGTILIVFCGFQLFAQGRLRTDRGGRLADALVGLCGGFLGGLAGLSGPLPTMWASVRGLAKDDKRALFQSFNMTMLVAMLCASAVQGLIGWQFGRALLYAVPAAVIGSRAGHWAYHRLDDHRYDRLVLALLLMSGTSLLWSNL